MSVIPENIIHSGTPSRSALRVAMVRASHQLLDEPLIFDDAFALPILGAETASAIVADPFQFNDPMSRGMRASLIARSKYAEDELRKSVQAGVRQYVVLGAGLDTFSLRNPYASEGLKVYEADHPSTQEWKKTLLHNAGIAMPKEAAFAAVDFERKTLLEGLREAGFRADQPAFFSWLGVTLYLTRDAISETLRFVSALPKGSAITFDYGVQPSLLNPIERAVMEYVSQIFEQQGEPWISFFDPAELGAEIRKMGFAHIDDVGPDDLNPRYFARRKDGLRTGGGSRLMCARV